MFLHKIDQIDLTQKFQSFLLPIIWVDEVCVVCSQFTNILALHWISEFSPNFSISLQGICLNNDMVALLKRKMITILLLLDIMEWSLIVGGLCFTLITVVAYYLKRRTQTWKVYHLNWFWIGYFCFVVLNKEFWIFVRKIKFVFVLDISKSKVKSLMYTLSMYEKVWLRIKLALSV